MSERCGLVHVCNVVSDSEPKLSVNIAKELTTEDREKLLDADRAIQNALSSLHIYKCVMYNYQDLIETCEDVLHSYASHNLDLGQEFDDIFMEVSRKLLNLSASFGSYIDHQEIHFSQTYGKRSEVTLNWKAARDKIRDSSVAFPLMRDLRNYVLHVDLPPLHASLSSNLEEHTLELTLLKKRLLRPNANWNAEVRRYISSHDGDIPLLELVSLWLVCFQALARYTNEVRLGDAYASAELLLGIRRMFNIADGGMIGLWDDYPLHRVDSLQMHLAWLNEAGARQLLALKAATEAS